MVSKNITFNALKSVFLATHRNAISRKKLSANILSCIIFIVIKAASLCHKKSSLRSCYVYNEINYSLRNSSIDSVSVNYLYLYRDIFNMLYFGVLIEIKYVNEYNFISRYIEDFFLLLLFTKNKHKITVF